MPITPMTSSATTNAIERFADGAATKADDSIQAAKQVANEALDSLQSTVDDLRRGVPSTLSRAAAQVDELTHRGVERARDAGQQLREQAERVNDSTVSWIRDEPVKSVLIAAAAGAAMAALVGWLARSRSSSSSNRP